MPRSWHSPARSAGKSLADNIRVVGINPGPVGTDRNITLLKTAAKTSSATRAATPSFRRACRSAAPRMRERSANLMAFLASDRSGYTSGVIYTVDGGLSAGWG